MKIVFNYNNSDFPCPSPAPLFSPVSALFFPAILYRKKYHLEHGLALKYAPPTRITWLVGYRDLCGNIFSDGTLATSTVRFWWFRKVLIFRLLQRLKNRGVEVVEKFFAYFHGVFCNRLIFRML